MSSPKLPPFLSLLAVASVLTTGPVGCGSGGMPANTPPVTSTPTTPTTPSPNSGDNLSGNWQGLLSATGGTKALGAIAGSIDQSGGQTSGGQFTTSVFRIDSPCYTASPSVPAQGFVNGTAITLNSFAVDSQYLTLTGTSTNTGNSIAGNYVVFGGCAEGGRGTFNIVRYQPFTATYVGSLNDSTGNVISLTLTSVQSTGAGGSGSFSVRATANFSGVTCFSTSSAGTGSVSGSSVALDSVTNDRAGSTIRITGTLSPDANTLSAIAYTISGGACDGQTARGRLERRA